MKPSVNNPWPVTHAEILRDSLSEAISRILRSQDSVDALRALIVASKTEEYSKYLTSVLHVYGEPEMMARPGSAQTKWVFEGKQEHLARKLEKLIALDWVRIEVSLALESSSDAATPIAKIYAFLNWHLAPQFQGPSLTQLLTILQTTRAFAVPLNVMAKMLVDAIRDTGEVPDTWIPLAAVSNVYMGQVVKIADWGTAHVEKIHIPIGEWETGKPRFRLIGHRP